MIRALLIILMLMTTIGPSGSALSATSTSPFGVRLLRADATGLELEWTAPSVQLKSLDDGTVEVVAEGYSQTSKPGAPRLPFTSSLIALPSGATPHLRILSIDDERQRLSASLALAPLPAGIVRDHLSRPIGGAFAPVDLASNANATAPVTLEELGVIRGVRLARLVFYPALPDNDGLRVVRRLQVQVTWTEQPLVSSAQPDLLLSGVRQVVLNPWDAIPSAPSKQRTLVQRPFAVGAPEVLIEIAAPGLYRVNYGDLMELGLTDTDPNNLRLFQGTDEVAFTWEGNSDTVFQPEEALLFYANPRFSRWTTTDVYRLVADSTHGTRVATRSADPTALPAGTPWVEQLIEENHIYTPDCFCGHLPTGRDDDRWTWTDLSQPGVPTSTLPFQTTALNASVPATLTLWMIGYTEDRFDAPDHRVEVSLNNTFVGGIEWDGKTAITSTLSIAPGVLQSGPNMLTLTLPGLPNVFPEGAWLDGFTVRYARSATTAGNSQRFDGQVGQHSYTVGLPGTGELHAYDITNPTQPQSLIDLVTDAGSVSLGDPPSSSPRRYIVANADGILRPARIRAPEDPWAFQPTVGFTGADVVMVTHPNFASALTPLVSLRQSQGMSTAVVNVLGIYDTWGDGRPDPETIRSFIADAYASWDPRPAYILLVGDGSFDPKGYQPGSPATFIPPHLADVDPWAGETAADNRYVCVDGDDNLPDLMLGRLPIDSLEEANAVVAKIVSYETNPFPGDWNSNVLLVADDADTAGDFAASSEAIAEAHVTEPFAATRYYCTGTLSRESDCSPQEAETVQAALQRDWNWGALVIQFTGHSSWQQWAAERFLHLDDLYGLKNERRLPVVVEMTCFTGAYQRPELTLDEELVTLPVNGAVAAWGPTGLGVGTGHSELADGFFSDLFLQSSRTLGEAALAGKLAVATSGQHLDLLDTYILLGDPTMGLGLTVVPWPHEMYLPLVQEGG